MLEFVAALRGQGRARKFQGRAVCGYCRRRGDRIGWRGCGRRIGLSRIRPLSQGGGTKQNQGDGRRQVSFHNGLLKKRIDEKGNLSSIRATRAKVQKLS